MPTYTAYGLNIDSEFPLPELLLTDESADVSITLGNLSNISPDNLNQGTHCLGKIEGVGRFLITEGRRIVVHPDPGVDTAVIRPSLLGSALAVLLRQRGLTVLHASSVAIQDQAIAFLGSSGSGKSTLASAFHRRGYKLLTDDVLALKIESEIPWVLPSFPHIKLWPEAAISLGYSLEQLPVLHSQSPKRSHQLVDLFERPLPLRRIYLLSGIGTPAIAPLSPQDSFTSLLCHSRAVQTLIAPEFVQSHFYQCTNLIRSVSIYQLIRQQSLAALSDLVQLIEEDLDLTLSQPSYYQIA